MLIAYVVLVESPCVVGPEGALYICLAAHPCSRFVCEPQNFFCWILWTSILNDLDRDPEGLNN